MATFTRIKTWVSNEVLTAADLNSEFNNILNNTSPTGIEDASSNVAAMQATTDPGGVGSESLATDLLGEIKRLRYAIKRIAGGAQWYTAPVIDLGSTISAADLATDAVETAKIKDLNVTTAKLAANAVTRAKLEAVGQQLSSSSGNYSTSSGTFTAVTNLSCTITSTGRPIRIEVISDGSGNASECYVGKNNDTTSGTWRIKRDSTEIARLQVTGIGTSDPNHYLSFALPSTLDIVAAGTYVYTVEVSCDNSLVMKYVKLLVFEL